MKLRCANWAALLSRLKPTYVSLLSYLKKIGNVFIILKKGSVFINRHEKTYGVLASSSSLLGRGCLCMLSELRCHVSVNTSINRISTVFARSCQVLKPVRCIFQLQALKWTSVTSLSTTCDITSKWTLECHETFLWRVNIHEATS